MTGTRSNPGAGFALGRMGFVIGSRGSVCIQAAIPRFRRLKSHSAARKALFLPCPRMRCTCGRCAPGCSLGIFSFAVACLPSTAVMCRDESHGVERKPRASEGSSAERGVQNRRISTIRNQRSTLTREYHAGIFSIRSIFGADFACVEEPAGHLTDAAA